MSLIEVECVHPSHSLSLVQVSKADTRDHHNDMATWQQCMKNDTQFFGHEKTSQFV